MTSPADILDYEALLRRGDEDDEPRFNSGGYRREPNFILKDTGDTAVLRMLAESKDWYRALSHRYVTVTKGKPEGHEGKWPEGMSATCRRDGLLKKLYADGCPICSSPLKTKFDKTMEESAADLRYTLAVEREEVTGDGSPAMGGPEFLGQKGWVDKMVDVPIFDSEGKATKETVKRPSIVILSGSMYQMFGALKATGEGYGTLRDRDFRVKKIANPSGKGDVFLWTGLDRIDSIKPGTEAWGIYEETVKAWVPGGLSLARIIVEKSAAPYYERFWTTDGVFQMPGQSRNAVTSTGFTPASAATPTEEPDAAKLAAMRARIMGNSPAPADAPVSAES
jgi:hypothetical protein